MGHATLECEYFGTKSRTQAVRLVRVGGRAQSRTPQLAAVSEPHGSGRGGERRTAGAYWQIASGEWRAVQQARSDEPAGIPGGARRTQRVGAGPQNQKRCGVLRLVFATNPVYAIASSGHSCRRTRGQQRIGSCSRGTTVCRPVAVAAMNATTAAGNLPIAGRGRFSFMPTKSTGRATMNRRIQAGRKRPSGERWCAPRCAGGAAHAFRGSARALVKEGLDRRMCQAYLVHP